MTEEIFQAKLTEAREKILALPEEHRAPLLKLLTETTKRHEELKTSFARIHEALAEWQVLVKYLIFDREATRRERDELRRRLGEQA